MKARFTIVSFLCFVLCLTCSIDLYAQTSHTITGTIVDELEMPLPGANAVIMRDKKMVKGASTNIDGNFKIDLAFDENDKLTLVLSYMGYKDQKIKLNAQNIGKPFNIQLTPDNEMLEEVTIVEDGYARLPRKDMVGAFTTVKADDIMMPAYQSIDQMLQGKVAGMSVVNTSARVGASPKITIRGTSTILGNTSPLWVVDGVIQEDPLSIDISAALMSIDNGSSWITPSTTHSGLVLPRIVDVPRMVILGEAPTRADVFTTDIPATLPCNIWSMLWYAGIMMSSAFTVVNAPTMSLRGRRA